MDGLKVPGRTKDVTVIGLGMSTLDDEEKAVAAEAHAAAGRGAGEGFLLPLGPL